MIDDIELIYHDCDQIASDIKDSEAEMLRNHHVSVSLNYHTVERLMKRINVTCPVEDFEELLEDALDQEERYESFLNGMQRKGYKKCLGKIYGRRSAEAQKRNRAWMTQHGFT